MLTAKIAFASQGLQVSEPPKNVALFIDGTWNRPGQSKDTNVLKLFEATPRLSDAGGSQVSHYLDGVGERRWWFELDEHERRQRAFLQRYAGREMPLDLRPFRWLVGGALGLGTAFRIR